MQPTTSILLGIRPFVLLLVAAGAMLGPMAYAQDNPGGGEPVVAAIDPAALTYDYLVDGDLKQDEPQNKKFKTLQAACEAAAAGTENKPTVIGIRPNVYHLPGGENGPSLNLTKNYITLLGLTNNRRSVVLADNRGHSQGASDNGVLLSVDAAGFTMRNLTVLNYCNVDYVYPGNPGKNLAKRSDVITQAVALRVSGDKHVYENVAILSRLDTMFLRTTRSYFRNVYIEGTDDFIGGGQVSVWEDCTVAFPTGSGVMLASNIAFLNCKFEATRGLQFYKSEFGSGRGRPVALINCVLPVSSPQAPVAWVRGKAAPRPGLFSLTYRTKDTTGKPAVLYDSTLETDRFTYSRELSDREALAFNPWNMLRAAPGGAADDWDPAGVMQKYEAADQGSAVFRMAWTGAPATIRTGEPGAAIRVTLSPERVADKSVKWSVDSDLVSTSPTPDGRILVTGRNTTDTPQYVPVTATASNGFFATEYVLVEPARTDPPAVTAAPTLDAPVDGAVRVQYTLDLGRHEDQSLITWSLSDDAAGNTTRDVAVSRGNQPLKTLTLTSGAVGKYVKAVIQPKHPLSDLGTAVTAISKTPIAAADVKSRGDSPNFRNFVTAPRTDFASGLWTVMGTWTIEHDAKFENEYGIRAGSVGASLLYPQDAPTGDMQVDLTISPEKTGGQGFGSAGSSADGDTAQKSDVFIKYDPRTRNGYSLRFWRTTQSAEKCMFQLFKIENGVGSPLNEQQVLSGVFKPTTHLTVEVVGDQLTATASNDVDRETLSLTGTITKNPFGGAGVYWSGSVPRGNSVVYSRIQITYP